MPSPGDRPWWVTSRCPRHTQALTDIKHTTLTRQRQALWYVQPTTRPQAAAALGVEEGLRPKRGRRGRPTRCANMRRALLATRARRAEEGLQGGLGVALRLGGGQVQLLHPPQSVEVLGRRVHRLLPHGILVLLLQRRPRCIEGPGDRALSCAVACHRAMPRAHGGWGHGALWREGQWSL